MGRVPRGNVAHFFPFGVGDFLSGISEIQLSHQQGKERAAAHKDTNMMEKDAKTI